MSRSFVEQEVFAKKLVDSLYTLLESYVKILNASRIGGKAQGRESAERERLQLTTHAAGVVAEAQALFKMITEIKLSVLTSNIEDLNSFVEDRNQKFEKERQESERNLKILQADIDSALMKLEKHYYSSVYRS